MNIKDYDDDYADNDGKGRKRLDMSPTKVLLKCLVWQKSQEMCKTIERSCRYVTVCTVINKYVLVKYLCIYVRNSSKRVSLYIYACKSILAVGSIAMN